MVASLAVGLTRPVTLGWRVPKFFAGRLETPNWHFQIALARARRELLIMKESDVMGVLEGRPPLRRAA